METKLSVTLIQHTPEPEKLVAAAAKLCYSKAGASEIMEDLTEENVDRFLDRLMDVGHASPIEHASFTFAIEGVSRALTHQLVRHRIASFSQKSQRYVSEGQFHYIVPPAIKEVPGGEEDFFAAMVNAQKSYDLLVEKLTAKYLDEMETGGTKTKADFASAEKKAIEDARFVLPNACETKIVVTMNVRSLLHFFNQRCCNRAQWEIRQMAILMLIECKYVAPLLFKTAGPRCLVGKCPEGAMTCGKKDEVEALFEGIEETGSPDGWASLVEEDVPAEDGLNQIIGYYPVSDDDESWKYADDNAFERSQESYQERHKNELLDEEELTV